MFLEGVDFDHKPLWTPNKPDEDGTPNPQQMAVESLADELFYGGAAGGGKTDLILGLSLTRHKRSLILRRIYPNMSAIVDRSEDIVGEKGSYNRVRGRWLVTGRMVDFGSVQYEKDKKNYQGRPYDFYGFDEITEFTRTQFTFMTAWNRSVDQSQRCRVVVTGNPPTDDAGSWVIEEWAPWLDPEYIDPVEPGELRWFHRDGDRLEWYETPTIEVDGEVVHLRSRTFIPANLSDNPWLSSDPAYRSVLNSLPEPLRSQLLRGDFTAAAEANPWQAIPTEWVQLAQKRWLEAAIESDERVLDAIGLDSARGGKDKTAIAKLYDDERYEYVAFPGIVTPNGPSVVARLVEYLGVELPTYITIDVIGIGSSVFDSAEDAYADIPNVEVYALNVAGKSTYTDRSGALKMRNLRAEMYWRMRELLDPEHGSDISLPPGNEVLADLCSARYKHTPSGIDIEGKDAIKERIGRSPDIGEAIMMANLAPPQPEKKRKAWVHRS